MAGKLIRSLVLLLTSEELIQLEVQGGVVFTSRIVITCEYSRNMLLRWLLESHVMSVLKVGISKISK